MLVWGIWKFVILCSTFETILFFCFSIVNWSLRHIFLFFNVNWGFEAFVEAFVVFWFCNPLTFEEIWHWWVYFCVCLFERVETHSYFWTFEMESFQCELIVSWEFKEIKVHYWEVTGGCIQIIGLRISSFTRSVFFFFFFSKNWPWEPQSKTIKHPCTQPIHS